MTESTEERRDERIFVVIFCQTLRAIILTPFSAMTLSPNFRRIFPSLVNTPQAAVAALTVNGTD